MAEHADRADVARFATSSVFLRVNPDNTFEAVATDTKQLVRVTGPCVAVPTAFPASEEFAAKPDGAATALIPAEFWRKAFTWGRKLAGKSRGDNPSPKCVAVRVGEAETSFAAANEYYQWCESVQNATGRYPPYGDILARSLQAPQDRIGVDPQLFTELLRTATECGPDANGPNVVIETNGALKPLVIRRAPREGLEFTGVLMPLTPDTPVAPPAPVPPTVTTAAEWVAANTGPVSLLPEPAALTSADLARLATVLYGGGSSRSNAEQEPDRAADAERIVRLESEREDLARQVEELRARACRSRPAPADAYFTTFAPGMASKGLSSSSGNWNASATFVM